MNCPLKTFGKCPKHNEDGGCMWWLSYTSNRETGSNEIKGCAVTLTPMLLLENANNLGIVAGEVNKVGAEVSAGRAENIKEQQASRVQLLTLAQGNKELVNADHNTTIKGISYE